jgi:outer membrane receptor for ferrienterochelin and colicin
MVATLALRIDRNDRTGSKASPCVALAWHATPEITVEAMCGRAMAVRAPMRAV